VVEVRTISGPGDPIDAIDVGKRRRVGRLAANLHADRTDFLGIAIRDEAIEVHWVPG
jgi:Holliday junction resolvase-like predicted endonuclease